jgi:hypothetical protein
MRIYHYVGSEETRLSTINFPRGTIINSRPDLEQWIDNNSVDRTASYHHPIVATFIIDLEGNILLADRHSEHVSCAAGEPVLSAGEIFIDRDGGNLELSEITNQSTGYCPEIESWIHVESALKHLEISHPLGFTIEFIFRRCPSCSQINIVKNDLFACSVCNSTLPDRWNFDR